MIKAYFFDFDGTLGDTEVDIRGAWLAAIAKLALPKENFDRNFMVGPSLQETSAMLYPDMPLDEQKVLQETYKSFYDDAESYLAMPYPGIVDILKKLHQAGKKIYVVTNKRYKPLYKLMKKFDIIDWCDGIFSPDIVDPVNHLTKPDLLALALKISGSPADQALMIGDTTIDINAAKINSMLSCAVTWGCGSVESLKKAMPDYMIDDPAQLP